MHRAEELTESDVGKDCGLFEVKQIADEYYAFFKECKNPSACTIVLRGASADSLNELERNLEDCIGTAKNIMIDPKLVAGGGATDMAMS